MTRTKKSILLIAIAVLLAGCMVFTSYSAGTSLAKPDGKPPMMQDFDKSGENGSSDNSHGNQPPSPPNSDNSNSGDTGSSDNTQSNQPPDMPDNDSGNSDSTSNNDNSSAQPPAPPDGSSDKPDKSGKGGDFGKGASMSNIGAPWYILFGVEGLAFALVLVYLIMSNLSSVDAQSGTTTFNKNRLAAFVIASVLLAAALVPAQAALTTSVFAKGGPGHSDQLPGGPGGNGPGNSDGENGPGNGPGQGDQESSVEATGATTVDGTEETLNDSYSSTNADENAILVTNGGSLTSDGAKINKKSGDSSNTGSSDFSGVNAGILVNENSSATLKNATIKTSAKGANAVFATGEKSTVTISDSTISTTGESSSRGLDATYGGTIKADNVTITTQGGSCAAMATDRGEGTVSATNSTLETNGAGSPVIYSTGNITLTDSTGTANGAQITVVEGKNSATIENSKVTCSAAGNRGDVDVAGVMIYQSMSGDADQGTGNFTAKDSTLSIDKKSKYYKTAPMFFVTNTNAVIDLENTSLNFGSGTLLNAQGTSEWGNEGSNGGNVTLNATAQKLAGDIQLDMLSTLNMTLTGSTYKGTINGDKTAKSVTLKLDKKSKITLTGDSYVDSLEDADSSYSNIDFNGHKLYVNGKAIN